jgi:hypothetical protein
VPRISVHGRALEVPTEAAITWAAATIVAPLEIVSAAHWGLSLAMPGRAVGDYIRLIQELVTQIEEAEPLLDDHDLIEAAKIAKPPLTEFAEAGLALRAWQQGNVSARARTAHNRTTRELGPRDPPWCSEVGFSTRLHEVSQAFSRYLDALAQVVPPLRARLPADEATPLTEQFDRVLQQIPVLRSILMYGYAEAARRHGAEEGDVSSA